MSYLNLWIDDDRVFLDGAIKRFEDTELKFEDFTDGAEAIKRLKLMEDKFSTALIDLRMPNKDGFQIYQQIKLVNPKIRTIFVSAFLEDPQYEQRLDDLDIECLEKPIPGRYSQEIHGVIETIRRERRKFIEDSIDPFNLDLASFHALDDNELIAVYDCAEKKTAAFVTSYFEQHPDEDWVMIAQKANKKIAAGTFANEPSRSEIRRKSEKLNAPVFTYTRPKHVIEQTDHHSPKWSPKKNDDLYPTIRINFPKQTEGKVLIKGDFDTGATASFLSYEYLVNKDVIDRHFEFTTRRLWQKSYRMSEESIPCEVVGRAGQQAINLECEVVQNWAQSPQVMNYDRVALIGRNILKDNKLKVLLDGESKETDIL